ncbi:MAG: YdcF family protein [Candidatus Omnitrophica bacterium]|nr:YdcF family protein [Candidatus Omnitrophota bacterium]
MGNPNLNVFRQALRLWRDHQNSRIVTLGGVARFTQPLIDNARNAGFELKDVSSEAVIMRQVMEQMIEKEKEFEDLKGQMPDFEIESQSRNTPQNILNYKKIIASELQNRSAENPYRIVYLQTPHQQLRAKATVDKYFADELKSGRLEAFSGTAEYRLEGKSAYEIAEDLLGEAVRFIIYSGYGNKSIYAPDLSSNFWNDSRALYDSLSGDEKDRVSVFLGSLIADSKVSLEDLNDEMSFARPTPGAYAQVIFLKPIIARYLANEYFETNPWKLIHGMEILGYDQFRTVDWEHAKKLKQAGIEEWSRRMGRFNKEAFSEFNSIKGTILDPLNKNGIWQEAADGETVDLKANVNLTENEVRQIAGSDFEDIWAAIQFCYAKREWDKKIHQTDMEIMMSTWGGYDYILRSNVDDLIKQGKAFAKLVGALTPATVEVKVYPKMQKFRDYTYLLPEKYQERVEKFLHMQGADRAMLQTPGGIDLNKILIHRTGHVIQMKFDPAQLNELQQGGFQGFQPVIINIQPIASPFALLGLKQPAKEPELLAKV